MKGGLHWIRQRIESGPRYGSKAAPPLSPVVLEAIARSASNRALHASNASILDDLAVKLELQLNIAKEEEERARTVRADLESALCRVSAERERREKAAQLGEPTPLKSQHHLEEEPVPEEPMSTPEPSLDVGAVAVAVAEQRPELSFLQESAATRHRLLCSQYTEGEQRWQTTTGSFTQLGPADCQLRELPDSSDLAGCFESYTALALPDSPPPKRPSAQQISGADHTEVHRFVLHRSIAAQLNEGIRSEAQGLVDACARGIRRSNVGGFHSDEELFGGCGSSSAWYGRVHKVLLEALRTIHSGEGDEGSDEDGGSRTAWEAVRSMPIAGWINASRETQFNLLHDHGNAIWSAVLMVDAPPATPARHAAAATRSPLIWIFSRARCFSAHSVLPSRPTSPSSQYHHGQAICGSFRAICRTPCFQGRCRRRRATTVR